jgi:uncharacterized YigZ family protein
MLNLFSDTYSVPAAKAEASLRERGSRFLAYAIPCQNEESAQIALQELRKQFPDATHHCYAMVLGADGSYRKSSDDGEPAHSAGKPILRAILAAGLTQILVVVVRYFGGTQLGIPGLIQAYGQSAALAIEGAGKVEHCIEQGFLFQAPHGKENDIYRLLQTLHARIIETRYEPEGIHIHAMLGLTEARALESKAADHYYPVQFSLLKD